jgi:two-component system, sensor histidine kinase and response regulator
MTQPYSILVIDDEPDNFETIESLLPPDTYDLHYASSGTQAIASLDKYAPDLILLDIMMPGMDGFETCRTIKSISRWQPVPIIIITALSSKHDLARCLAEGADEFLTKPVDALELRARIHSMLRIKKQFDRIESLCKLQRNNIKSLERDLSDIGSDLAAGFAQELNVPLKQILGDLKSSIDGVDSLDRRGFSDILTRNYQTATELDNLMAEFWLYLEFSLAAKQFKLDETCKSKEIVEESLAATGANPATCDISDIALAVSPHHYQWIVHKLLSSNNSETIAVVGNVIDRMFYLTVRVNTDFNEHLEPPLGIKIVNKIVETYGGLFMYSASPENKTNMCITLPLAS